MKLFGLLWRVQTGVAEEERCASCLEGAARCQSSAEGVP